MYFLYSLVLTALFFLLLPYFIYQAARHGKYFSSFKERLGRLPKSMRLDGRRTIWVHAVSVGEFNAARPLIAAIRKGFPEYAVVVSTTTITGQRLARTQAAGLADAVFYFPFDWCFAVRRALDHVRPAMVVIVETELWPNFLRECRERGVNTVLVNGRISPRSFPRYRRVRSFISRALNDLSVLLMQSADDATRARLLGAEVARVRVCGNLKYDTGGEARSEPVAEEIEELLDRAFALSSEQLIVAGSTGPGEEEMLLAALGRLRARPGLEKTRLMIAPRHPERFDEVAGLIARSGFSFVRRSWQRDGRRVQSGEESIARTTPSDATVILLDTIGELAGAYRFASVVFVGGSLVPRGGHNVIEAAVHAAPIVVGPHMENFRQIMADFLRERAIVQIPPGAGQPDSLTEELAGLLSDPRLASELGRRARGLIDANRGATDCVMAAIRSLLIER